MGSHAVAAPAPTAVEQLKQSQSDLRRDKDKQDWTAYLTDARQLNAFLNDSPRSVLEVARAELQLGHVEAARALAERFLAMGQTNPVLATPLFVPIAPALGPAEHRNEVPISLGRLVARLSDPGLVAEDIDYDRKSDRFFVTSILEHRIVAVTRDGSARRFADAPDGWPMLALKIDAAKRRLWATEVAFDGFDGVAAQDAGRSVILEYDLDTAKPLLRLEGPAHSALGDLSLAVNGDPIISDNDGGGVYRLHAGQLSRIDHGDFISPQTPAVCPDGHVFVPDYVRGVASLDLESGQARWLATRGRFALSGIDGLYCRAGELIATQNGASPERVVRFRLNASETAIIGESILERATPLTDPTHGVMVGKAFYYIGNAGWAALDDHGHVNAGASLTPAVIMVARWR